MLRPGAHIDNYYSASPQYPTSSSASLNRFFPPPPPPPPANRYPGDGLDFRRPAMSTSMPSNDVIDLTGSDSPPSRPQSGRISPGQRTQRPGLEQEVITLEDSEDEGGGRPRRRRRHEEAPSMDVEFLRSRTLRPPTPPDYAPRGLAWHAERARERVDRQPSWANGFFDLGDHLPNLNPFAHSRLLTGFARGTRRPRPNLPTIQAARRSETLLRPHAVHFAGNFTPPELNYHGAAFTVGRPEPVQYEAPEAPEPGFTRTPNKDDVLVCPNCDRELGTGDTDLGKQIWVIRSCGHVRQIPSGFDISLTFARFIVVIVRQDDIDQKRKGTARPKRLRTALLTLAERKVYRAARLCSRCTSRGYRDSNNWHGVSTSWATLHTHHDQNA
jgi:hypothetical protein